MKREKTQLTQAQKIIIVLAIVGAGLLVTGVIIGDSGLMGNLIIIALFINVLPYFLYRYSRFVWLRNVEIQFPNFIRDLADSVRSGMSLPEAIGIVSRSNYGKLTEEVIKMNNRLSWGTPFLRVMEIFEKKVEKSKMITEAIKIIKESYQSGGNIVSTLDAVSNDIMMLKEAEAERASLVKEQILIMYGIFVMFLIVSIIIINVMVPMMATQPKMAQQDNQYLLFQNPCENSVGFPCSLFSFISSMIGISPTGIASYYVALFFLTVLIQGLFIGLIAGQIGENSIIAGFKHSIIMIFATISTFLFLAKIGLLAAA